MAATVKLVRAGKVLLVVTLISIFRKYFGIKSWERYKREKVLVMSVQHFTYIAMNATLVLHLMYIAEPGKI